MVQLCGSLRRRVLSLLTSLALLTGLAASTVSGHAANDCSQGTIGGATYKIEKPAAWNGTLVLYSHGYVTPGSANPARDVGDPATGAFLLAHGYALAGSSYSRTGWALEQAFVDQIALLDFFEQNCGHPKRILAWGHSLGGIITAGLIQKFPERFSGALPMCGVLAGGVGVWNEGLDGEFVFKTLLAPNSPLNLVQIANPGGNLALAEQILATAQGTPQGRARLALVAAVGDLPGWFDPASPEPGSEDFAAQEFNQFLWNSRVDFPFGFALRAELEFRAKGNPSWNTGVDYRKQLDRSIDREEVEALYEQAGLDLDQDLETLNRAPRIAADAAAAQYLIQNIIFNGNLHGLPVLTMHTSGDGLVLVQDAQAYAGAVRAAGNQKLLREIFVHRAGHCSFTPAETITAFQTLVHRLDAGKWSDTDEPAVLNAQAMALGPLNIASPAFFEFEPSVFLRPFDTRSLRHNDSDDE